MIDIANLCDCPEHLPLVAQWVYDEWSHRNPNTTPRDVENRFRKHLTPGQIPLTLVARNEGQPIATASIFLHDMATHLHLSPWLAAVYVVPEWRGQGIGSHIVTSIESTARELGIIALHLFTPDRQSFYARLGWKVREQTPYRERDITIMQKVL